MDDGENGAEAERAAELEFVRNRGKGFLTKRDREWLVGGVPEEKEKNTVRQFRSTVRRRLKCAIQDFHILLRHYSEREVRLTFDELSDFEERLMSGGEISTEEVTFYAGAEGALAILYEGLGREVFEEQLEKAATKVEDGSRTESLAPETDLKMRPRVEVDIQVPEMVNMGDLAKKFGSEQATSFTNAEVGVLMQMLQRADIRMPETEEEFLELYSKEVEAKSGEEIDDMEAVREALHREGRPVRESADPLGDGLNFDKIEEKLSRRGIGALTEEELLAVIASSQDEDDSSHSQAVDILETIAFLTYRKNRQ